MSGKSVHITSKKSGPDPKIAELHKKSKKLWTLDDWVLGLYGIYRDHDVETPPSDIWLQVVNDASQLAEEVRKENFKPTSSSDGVLQQAVKMFCWLCSFVGKYTCEPTANLKNDPIGSLLVDFNNTNDFIRGKETFSKWIILKFPGVCHVCGSSPCFCSSYGEIVESRDVDPRYGKLKERWKKKLEEAKKEFDNRKIKEYQKKPLNDWIRVFIDIYGGVHHRMTLDQVCFHLLEEVGEVSNEILYLTQLKKVQNRYADFVDIFNKSKESIETVISKGLSEEIELASKKKKGRELGEALYNLVLASNVENLKGELADVFSWLSAVLHKLDAIIDPGMGNARPRSYSFSREIEDYYKNFQGDLGCPACQGPKCKELCLLENLTTKILRKKNKMLSS